MKSLPLHPTPTTPQVGRRLRALREQARISLADLAQVADADLAKQAQVDHHQWDASAADHDGFDWAEFQQNWQATLDHAA